METKCEIRAMPRFPVWLLLMALFTLCPGIAAEEHVRPGGGQETREYVIDEPVFQGQAYVYEAGRAHPKTVVLVHGIGDQAARDWDGLIPLLAREFHVVTFDLPGFGRSGKGNKLYSTEKYVEFVRHVTQKYVHGPFMLVGHSLGGAIALRYAATYPDEVTGLVVADVPGILHRLSYSQYLSHLGITMLPDFYPNQKEQLHNLVGNILGVVEKLRPDMDRIAANPTLRENMLGGSPAKIAGLALVLDDYSGFILRVRVPVLVIWGAKDELAPLRTGKVLVGNMPEAGLVILRDSAHTPMEDAPAEFNSLVLDYLRRPAVPQGAYRQRIFHGPAASARQGSCRKNRGVVFEGDYDTVVIVDCRDVLVRNANIREIRITDASVSIENSRIGGDGGGLLADDANVTISGSVIEAAVAVKAIGSHLDLAGVRLIGREAAVRAPYKSKLLFSVSYISSPHNNGSVHGLREVGPNNPL